MFASDLGHHHAMAAILFGIFCALGSALRTRGDLILENLALRQQLAISKRTVDGPADRGGISDTAPKYMIRDGIYTSQACNRNSRALRRYGVCTRGLCARGRGGYAQARVLGFALRNQLLS
jgi:hypothetical protein